MNPREATTFEGCFLLRHCTSRASRASRHNGKENARVVSVASCVNARPCVSRSILARGVRQRRCVRTVADSRQSVSVRASGAQRREAKKSRCSYYALRYVGSRARASQSYRYPLFIAANRLNRCDGKSRTGRYAIDSVRRETDEEEARGGSTFSQRRRRVFINRALSSRPYTSSPSPRAYHVVMRQTVWPLYLPVTNASRNSVCAYVSPQRHDYDTSRRAAPTGKPVRILRREGDPAPSGAVVSSSSLLQPLSLLPLPPAYSSRHLVPTAASFLPYFHWHTAGQNLSPVTPLLSSWLRFSRTFVSLCLSASSTLSAICAKLSPTNYEEISTRFRRDCTRRSLRCNFFSRETSRSMIRGFSTRKLFWEIYSDPLSLAFVVSFDQRLV